MVDSAAPIGVFDSGVGGLTVMRRVVERLPAVPVVYFGDTARIPYGTRSPDTVIRYAMNCAPRVVERGVRLLIVACNTASAYALEALRDALEVPVLGVIEPGARHAVAATHTGRIGVIGTTATIASSRYQAAIGALLPEATVMTKACPLFVPLAEEGWTHGPVPEQVARTYLEDLLAEDIDTLVLGCTHYPLLREVIAEVAGAGVTIVDSAEATSAVVAETLEAMGDLNVANGPPRHEFLVTDAPDAFARLGRTFLGHAIDHVEWVDYA
jgi:glutamate racemase